MAAALFLALFASRIVLVDQTRHRGGVRGHRASRAGVHHRAGDHRQHGARPERADRRSLPCVAADAHAIRIGRWLGWSAVAAVCGLAAGSPLLAFSSTPGSWLGRSFAAETVIIASLALLLALALVGSSPPCSLFAMYLFARIGYLLVLLSANMGATKGSLIDRVDALALKRPGTCCRGWIALPIPRADRRCDQHWRGMAAGADLYRLARGRRQHRIAAQAVLDAKRDSKSSVESASAVGKVVRLSCGQRRVPTRACAVGPRTTLGAPPTVAEVRAASMGEQVFAGYLVALYLQNFNVHLARRPRWRTSTAAW